MVQELLILRLHKSKLQRKRDNKKSNKVLIMFGSKLNVGLSDHPLQIVDTSPWPLRARVIDATASVADLHLLPSHLHI